MAIIEERGAWARAKLEQLDLWSPSAKEDLKAIREEEQVLGDYPGNINATTILL
jgi:hypothetical protein